MAKVFTFSVGVRKTVYENGICRIKASSEEEARELANDLLHAGLLNVKECKYSREHKEFYSLGDLIKEEEMNLIFNKYTGMWERTI